MTIVTHSDAMSDVHTDFRNKYFFHDRVGIVIVVFIIPIIKFKFHYLIYFLKGKLIVYIEIK